MSAADRLARLLALVPWLVANDGITIDEASVHFGITPDELEKDLWLLVVSGLPGHGPDQLVDIDFWDDGVIHVIDPQTLDRPLRLTDEEAMILLVALRMLAQVPGLPDRSAIVSASAKLEAAVGARGVADAVPAVDVGITGEVRDAIDAAVAHGAGLRLTYASATRDEVSERDVAPIDISVVDGVGYLQAWCSEADALRTFRLDRIVQAQEIATVTIPPRPATTAAEPASARLLLEPGARWVVDVHRGATVEEERSSGQAIVVLPLLSVEWGVRLVLSLAGQATALEPPDLVAGVRSAAAAALAAYGTPTATDGHHVG